MTQRIRRLCYLLLPALLSLASLTAQATVFAGKLFGPTTQDPVDGGFPVSSAEIGFRYDSATTPYLAYSSSTASHASYYYDTSFPAGGGPSMYLKTQPFGLMEQGMFNWLDLYDDPTGQRVVFSAGSVHFGGMTATIMGPAGAFFSNALDLSTLHPGPVSGASGSVGTQFMRFELRYPNVVFAAPVPEPDILAMLGFGIAACAWASRRRGARLSRFAV